MGNWRAISLVIALAAPAFADATADARAHDDAFAKACEAGDVKGVVALYTDDAVVVWPGVEEEAKGKAQIEKLAPLERGQHLPARQRPQNPHREEMSLTGGTPAAAVGCEAAGGDEAVHVRMKRERARPRVQHGRDAELCAEPFGSRPSARSMCAAARSSSANSGRR